MGARRGWGGKREGAGRPRGSSPQSRRRRVVVLVTTAEYEALARLAKKARSTVGGLAYELVARALRPHSPPW